jgi:hypothetical protein
MWLPSEVRSGRVRSSSLRMQQIAAIRPSAIYYRCRPSCGLSRDGSMTALTESAVAGNVGPFEPFHINPNAAFGF